MMALFLESSPVEFKCNHYEKPHNNSCFTPKTREIVISLNVYTYIYMYIYIYLEFPYPKKKRVLQNIPLFSENPVFL